ncbi:hypothetical protein [Pseudomonas oryzicola]|uniref:Uncharacterized protein n=1 Tax=Pseudomonas oryzicola TaxID=485876 RepID=A0ABS6QBB2_9PSED|nr:hypothetical protein [Pseudomonas oryzicola]MBV4491490.1 hypothetical protein [Pseudomonas oryzicola]
MGKFTFCAAQLGRRSFIQSCVLLGVGGAVFGTATAIASERGAKRGHVLINGWVLPSRYFRNEQA